MLALTGVGCRPQRADDTGCTKDTDCKGERVCDAGQCAAPPSSEAAAGGPRKRKPAPRSWARGGPGGAEQAVGIGPAKPPTVLWDIDLGAVVFARAALGTGPGNAAVAYVGTHAGRFVGVVAEGEHAGRLELDLTLGGMVWATAAIDSQGVVYVGADDDKLYAIDPHKRELVWTLAVGNCRPTRAPGPEGARCDADGGPTIGPDGDLYLGADGVYRISRSGEIRWHWPQDQDKTPKHVFSSPVVTRDGSIYVGGQDGFLTALSSEGKRKWQYRVRSDVDGSPAIGIDGTIYVGADDGRVHAVRNDGSLKWSFVAQKDIRSAVAVADDGTIYVTSFDGSLYALDPDGDVRWALATGGRIASSPILDADGVIYVGSQDDHLYAINPKGTVRWTVELPGDIDSSVAISDAGTLVVGCDDGHLRALR